MQKLTINIKPHIGFSDDNTPKEVKWANGSFVRPVPPKDERSLGAFHMLLIYTCAALMFPAAIIFAIVYYTIGLESAPTLSIICFISCGCAALINILSPFILRWISIYKIGSRSELLSRPDRNSIYIVIENADTFSIPKHVPDDFGILNITSQSIQLEMSKYQAQIINEDLMASIALLDNVPRGIYLANLQANYPWSIVIMPVLAAPIHLFDKRLSKLMDRLKEVGIYNAEAQNFVKIKKKRQLWGRKKSKSSALRDSK